MQVTVKLEFGYLSLTHLPSDPMAPPAPVIQASSSSVAVGGNLRVSCSVVGEQDVVVEFTWEYPGQQVRHSEREG